MLAKTKGTSTTDENHLVAIKLVKAGTDKDTNYAHREIYILKEISHTNIMTIIESFEPTNPDQSGVAAIVLNYAKGKSLEFLLSRIGAPSLVFGRAVIAQLVDAVAYLHTVSRTWLHDLTIRRS
jgi:serine/threonine protein kinase